VTAPDSPSRDKGDIGMGEDRYGLGSIAFGYANFPTYSRTLKVLEEKLELGVERMRRCEPVGPLDSTYDAVRHRISDL
jgi:hypothetical protein